MAENQVIDLPTFEALRDAMGADFIGELIQAYLEETPMLIRKLKEALSRGDADAFRQSAHSIKSTSNSFGALQFGAMSRELEMMGRESRLDGADEKVSALVAGYAEVQAALEALRNG